MLRQFVANLLHKKNSDIRRWEHPHDMSMGVNFIGPVEFVNGLTVSARGYISSIMDTGVPINVIPWRLGFEHAVRIKADFPSINMQPINLVHLNLGDMDGANFLKRQPLRSLVTPDRYNICIPYWELASVYPEWCDVINHFDEIWCSSLFMARSIRAVTTRTVRVVCPGLDFSVQLSEKTRRDFGIPEDSYVFFYAADANSIMGRKNPGAFVDAYINEFGSKDGACCLLKISYSKTENPEFRRLQAIVKDRPDVIFMDAILTKEDMASLYNCIDCYVSPHRSEGLGLTIMEAMAANKPVIATPYGGATDFVTENTAFLIDYKLSEVGPGNAPYPASYVWADPIIDSIQKKMRFVFENPNQAKITAEKGCQYIKNHFSSENTSIVIEQELERIWLSGQRSS